MWTGKGAVIRVQVCMQKYILSDVERNRSYVSIYADIHIYSIYAHIY